MVPRDGGDGRPPWVSDCERFLYRRGLWFRGNEPLKDHTTFRIGGPARVWVTPRNERELVEILGAAIDRGWPAVVLGGGSNVLVADQGLDALAIGMTRLTQSLQLGPTCEVAAGWPIAFVARRAAQRGLSGLEFFAGVPGTVGGALAMNAGGREVEIGDLVESVRVYDCRVREIRTVSVGDMDFRYRSSALTHQPWIALSVRLQLRPTSVATSMFRMALFLARRRKAQPLPLPSAGSVFKNPPGARASILLESVGVRGWHEGDATVSALHANFILNAGHASARDVLRLMGRMRAAVARQSGILLEPEILGLGFDREWAEVFSPASDLTAQSVPERKRLGSTVLWKCGRAGLLSACPPVEPSARRRPLAMDGDAQRAEAIPRGRLPRWGPGPPTTPTRGRGRAREGQGPG
jgi:UDP-N-acetylmuramate dehydrogenase